MMNGREIERMVDAYIDNNLADVGAEWNELDEVEQEIWLREAVDVTAERLDIDVEDVWECLE